MQPRVWLRTASNIKDVRGQLDKEEGRL
jgi:hypothetical protein